MRAVAHWSELSDDEIVAMLVEHGGNHVEEETAQGLAAHRSAALCAQVIEAVWQCEQSDDFMGWR